MKLRASLVTLVLTAVVPVVLFALLILVLLHRTERASAERALVDTTRTLSVAVDREITVTVNTLAALATSVDLDTNDLRSFYEECGRVLRTQDRWSNIVLFGPTGAQLLDLVRPFGAALSPTQDRDTLDRAVRSRAPSVSNLFVGKISRRPTLAVHVPVIRDAMVKYVLAAGIDPAAMNAVLLRQGSPSEWTALLIDRNNVIISHTRRPPDVPGRPAVVPLAAQRADAPEGTFQETGQDGTPVYGTFQRSALSGWTVVTTVPVSIMEAPLQRSLWLLAGGVAVLLLSGVAGALVIGRSISFTVGGLTAAANALGHSEPVHAASRSRIEELATAQGALQRAAEVLRQRAEEREVMLDAMSKLSGAVEQTADLVIITDRQGRIEYVNPAFEALTGYPKGEVIGKTPRVLKSGSYDALYYRKLWNTIVSGRIFQDILLNRKKSGQLFFEEKTITPLRDARGEITHFVSTGKDITDRHRAETALNAIVKGTSPVTADEFFRSLVYHIASALGVKCAFVGELVGEDKSRVRTLAVWRDTAPGENFVYDVAGTPCAGVLAGGPAIYPRDAGQRFPADRRLHDLGAESYVGVPLVAASGVLGVLAVMHDHAMEDVEHSENILKVFAARAAAELERKRAEEAVRLAEEQLRQSQKMDLVGQLAGGIAHDFNNLLTVISGRTEMALRRLPADDPARRDVELVKNTAGRATRLTRHLLAFSRRQILQPRILDLNALVSAVSAVLRHLIGEHIELATVLDPELGRTRADPSQIEQVLMNLVVNARDAMTKGGRLTIETANVTATAENHAPSSSPPPGDLIVIRVTDTGSGMTPDVQARIFEPFFTTKEPGRGTGLGLSMVYGIVKQHEGHIAVDSRPGGGTTFTVYLPRVDAAVEPPLSDLAPTTERAGRVTILVVEDEADVRDLIEEVLTGYGYTVLTAPDGPRALRISREWLGPIDLLLTDLVMPHMSGRRLAEQMTPARPGIKVLYMSGYTDQVVRNEHILGRGTMLLSKPFTPTALVDKIHEILAAPADG